MKQQKTEKIELTTKREMYPKSFNPKIDFDTNLQFTKQSKGWEINWKNKRCKCVYDKNGLLRGLCLRCLEMKLDVNNQARAEAIQGCLEEIGKKYHHYIKGLEGNDNHYPKDSIAVMTYRAGLSTATETLDEILLQERQAIELLKLPQQEEDREAK